MTVADPDDRPQRLLRTDYKQAAPFVREYMDTMHGSIADTSFYMVRLSPAGTFAPALEASCFARRVERSARSHV